MEIERIARPDGFVVRLHGTLDQSFDRIELVRGLGGVVVFDLDDVALVSSSGVAEWMRALGDLKADGYYFVRCRSAVVARFNDVRGFGGRGQVVSFYLPYECTRCRRRFEVLHDLRRPHGWLASLMPPSANCPSCQASALFDSLPETYLTYLAKAPAPELSALAEELIDVAIEQPKESAAAKTETPPVDEKDAPASASTESNPEPEVRSAAPPPEPAAPLAPPPAAPLDPPVERTEELQLDSALITIDAAPQGPPVASADAPKPARRTVPPPPPAPAPPPARSLGAEGRKTWWAMASPLPARRVPWYMLPLTALFFTLVGLAIALVLVGRPSAPESGDLPAPAAPRAKGVTAKKKGAQVAAARPRDVQAPPPAQKAATPAVAASPPAAVTPSASPAAPAVATANVAPPAPPPAPPAEPVAAARSTPPAAPPAAAVAPPRAVRPDAPGRLTVFTTPRSTVTIDDQPPRPTPFIRISIPPGRHKLTFTAPDGRARSEFIFVRPDEHVRVDKNLR